MIERIADQTISSKIAKDVFTKAYGSDQGVDAIIEAEGLFQISDTDELRGIVEGILTANPEQVAQIKDGKMKVLGYLVGQTMRQTQGKADPQQVNQILKDLLSL